MDQEKKTNYQPLPPQFVSSKFGQYLNGTHNLFPVLQAIFSGIIFEQPEEPLKYIRKCLLKIQSVKQDDIKYDMFIKNFHPKVWPSHIYLTQGVQALLRVNEQREKEKAEEEEFERMIEYSTPKSKSSRSAKGFVDSIEIGPKDNFYITEPEIADE